MSNNSSASNLNPPKAEILKRSDPNAASRVSECLSIFSIN